MKIIKYKKMSNNRYKVFLEDGSNIILYEDIIIKYELLITKKIEDMSQIQKDNNNYAVYDMALKYINIKMRCEKEIRIYLLKKNIDENLIDITIKKLKDKGLLNERLYVKSYISDKIRLNKEGINKIRSELIKLDINKDIIEEEIENADIDEMNNNLEKLIDKKINSNKSYAGDVLKMHLLNEFINKGYEKEEILKVLSNKDLSNSDIYEKEYNKLYKKYSKKYSGNELEYVISNKLYQKGIKKMD